MTGKLIKISLIITIIFIIAPTVHISGQSSNGNPHLRTVVIDPGHGGKDTGCLGPDRKHDEKHVVLNISKLLGQKIKETYPSVKVAYTREGDTYPNLTDRVKIAHNHNADLFISIHCNASKNKSASGSSAHILARRDSRNPNRDLFDESVELTKQENSVFEFEEAQSGISDSAEDQILNSLLFHANFDHSVLLAQLVIENLAVKPFHKWGRGVHQNDFLLLKKMTCPAILVECAFLSNPEERQLLISDKWQREIADRLFEAFKQYKDVYDGSISSSELPVESPSEVSNEESYYSIQIMGLGKLLPSSDPAFKGLNVSAVKGKDSSIYKYITGKFSTKTEASADLSTIRKKFPEAFVVFIEGDKISRAK